MGLRHNLRVGALMLTVGFAASCTEELKTPARPGRTMGYAQVRADSIATGLVPFYEDSVALVIFSHLAPTDCRGVAIQMSLRSDFERIWGTAHDYPGTVECPFSRDTAFVLGWRMHEKYPLYIDFVQPDSSIIHVTELRRTHTVSAPH
jgi:hypothetical protein